MKKEIVEQPPQSPPSPSSFTRGELQANAKALFGVSAEVVAGALISNGREITWTIDEANGLIEKFRKRKVK